jgi:hypothetical protein
MDSENVEADIGLARSDPGTAGDTLALAGTVTPVRPRSRAGRSRHAKRPSATALAWLVGTVSSVAGIGVFSLWLGPAAINAPWDDFVLLNGAYRIYEGQTQGVSFSNPIGPLVYGLAAIGMHLQHGPSLAAVTDGQLIFLAIASSLAWIVAIRRLPALYAAAFTVFVAVLSISVRPLGYSPWNTTYAMLYNRDAWLLYSSLLLLVLLPRVGSVTTRTRLMDGFLIGLILGLIFYDKITFFLAGAAAVALGLALQVVPRSLRAAAGALTGLALVAVLAEAVFRVNTIAYVGDLTAAAKVQIAAQREGMLAHTILWVSPVGLLTVLVIGGLLYYTRRRGEPMPALVRLSIAVAFVLGSSILISAGDANEQDDLPALVVIPLLLVALLVPMLPLWAGGRKTASSRHWPRVPYRLLLTGLALLLIATTGPIVGKDALALGKAVEYKSYVADPPVSQRFDARQLGDFVIPASATWQTAYRTARYVPSMINNGLALLRQEIRPGQTVFTLAYTDPFSIALHLPLSTCGPLWWDLGYDFDQQHHPDAACAIGDADWVIIPRMVAGQGCCQATVQVMTKLYGGYLSEHYTKVRQTSDWILLQRIGITPLRRRRRSRRSASAVGGSQQVQA